MKLGKCLSGNQLKLLAAAFMIVDHVGLLFFPTLTVLRAIGRLSFPIFAYFIAEGCRYTKNRLRYFLTMALSAAISQTVYFIYSRDLKMCIFVTFTLSIAFTYALYGVKDAIFDKTRTRVKIFRSVTCAILLFGVVIATVAILDIDLDYGIGGALVPVVISLAHSPKNAPSYWSKIDTPRGILALFALSIAVICIGMPPIQLFSLASLVPIAFYNGKRGRARLKYFFYIFYPTHLVVLQGILYLVSK